MSVSCWITHARVQESRIRYHDTCFTYIWTFRYELFLRCVCNTEMNCHLSRRRMHLNPLQFNCSCWWWWMQFLFPISSSIVIRTMFLPLGEPAVIAYSTSKEPINGSLQGWLRTQSHAAMPEARSRTTTTYNVQYVHIPPPACQCGKPNGSTSRFKAQSMFVVSYYWKKEHCLVVRPYPSDLDTNQ